MEASGADREQKRSRARRLACAAMVAAAAGLLAAAALGAPLVSVLLIGILLLCPLLMWAPFRFEQRSQERATSGDVPLRGGGRRG